MENYIELDLKRQKDNNKKYTGLLKNKENTVVGDCIEEHGLFNHFYVTSFSITVTGFQSDDVF